MLRLIAVIFAGVIMVAAAGCASDMRNDGMMKNDDMMKKDGMKK